MKNILVIRPGAIGDTLLTFPVLKALRKRSDAACITLVSNAQVLPLAKAFGVAEQTFDFQDIYWSELFSSHGIRTFSLRDLLAQTDLAISWMRDPDGLVEYNLKTSGVKQVIIAPGRPTASLNLHIVDYLAQTIGLPDMVPQFFAHNESQNTSVGVRVDEEWLAGPLWSPVSDDYQSFIRFVAIHPGSGAVEKCWPISCFAEIIKRLWEQNQPVLLLSGPADTGRIVDLLNLISPLPSSEMFKMLTNAPLLEVAQHLQQCRCYLGNDSGITHLAAMLGVPTVAIFGPTDPQVWRPLGPFVRVIHGPQLETISEDAVSEAISSYAFGAL